MLISETLWNLRFIWVGIAQLMQRIEAKKMSTPRSFDLQRTKMFTFVTVFAFEFIGLLSEEFCLSLHDDDSYMPYKKCKSTHWLSFLNPERWKVRMKPTEQRISPNRHWQGLHHWRKRPLPKLVSKYKPNLRFCSQQHPKAHQTVCFPKTMQTYD